MFVLTRIKVYMCSQNYVFKIRQQCFQYEFLVNVIAGFIPPFKHTHLKTCSRGGKFSGGQKKNLCWETKAFFSFFCCILYMYCLPEKNPQSKCIYQCVHKSVCVCV